MGSLLQSALSYSFCLLFTSRFLAVLRWSFFDCWVFFPNVVHSHIWCVLWLLLSVSGASEIQALRFNNEPHESPWHCVYTVLCSGGRRGTGQPCQERGMVTPGTLWPLMQQWQGKCSHLFCALWRQGLPGMGEGWALSTSIYHWLHPCIWFSSWLTHVSNCFCTQGISKLKILISNLIMSEAIPCFFLFL